MKPTNEETYHHRMDQLIAQLHQVGNALGRLVTEIEAWQREEEGGR